MEMLKFLTQKLRQQSLNEVQPFQDPGIDDDRDSGTESDEENAELEALERAMQDREEDQENHGVPLSLSQLQGPPRCSSPSQSVTMTKRPLQQVNQLVNPDATFTTIQAQQRTDLNPYSSFSASSSPQGSSDFERCSLDYEPDSSNEFDRHSSEEELSVINLASNNREYPEKRKWSQANGRCSSCTESSGSSDEEVRDLLYNSTSPSLKKGSSHTIIKPQPLIFSSSPPSRGVHRLSSRYHYSHHHHHHHHHNHHHHHHSSLSPRLYLSSRHHSHHHTVSPRKRHRQSLSRDVTEASVLVQRPCLDFEKMQVSAPFFICIEPVMTMTSGVLGWSCYYLRLILPKKKWITKTNPTQEETIYCKDIWIIYK